MRRVAGLDGLRGVAVLSVVTYHATLRRFPIGGFFGVDLFFVLSGYLITSLLVAERERSGAISLRDFYRRRARRLLPALSLLLAAGLVVLTIALAEHRIHASYALELVAASTYTTNFFAAFNQLGVASHWIGGLWSLAAEEQFYVVWPLLLIWLLRRRPGETIRRVLVGLLLLAVAGFYATGATSSLKQLAYSPSARSIGIVAGCLLAFSPRSYRGGLVSGWLLYGLAVVVCPESKAAMLLFTPLGIAGAMLLVSNAHRSHVLAAKPLVWLGSISYSLYLWHPPLLWLLPHDRALAVTIAVVMATASTRWIETPIRRGGLAALRPRRLSATAEAAG